MVRLNYDENFKVLGAYLEGDAFEGPYIEAEDIAWHELNNQNKLIYLDKNNPSDLSKVTLIEDIQEPTPEILQLLEEGLKHQARRQAEATLQRIQVNEIASTLPKEKLLEIKALFPEWKDLIGKAIKKVDYPYILDEGELYSLNQDTLIQEQYKPSMPGMTAIFSKVSPPGEVAPWVKPTGSHDIYNKYGSGLTRSDPVSWVGKIWISTINNNDTEPGHNTIFGWWIEKVV